MLKDFSRYAGLTIINLVVSYILLWLLANQLTKVEYAQYGWYTTLFAIALIFINLGHRDALFKLSSQQAASLPSLLATALVTALIAFCIIAITAWFDSILLLISGAGFVMLHLLNMVSAVNRGQGRYQQDAMAIPVYRTVWLAGCVLLLLVVGQLTVYSVFATAILAATCALLTVGGLRTLRQQSDFSSLSMPLKHPTIRHFFFIELVTTSFMKTDLPLLTLYEFDAEHISEYFFAFQLYEVGILLLIPISYLFFNQLNQSTERELKIRTGIKALVMIGVLIALANLGWWLLGHWILDVFFPKYQASFALISWFLLALLPHSLNMLLAHTLFSVHGEKRYIQVVAVGVITLLLIDFMMIPAFGAEGAVQSRLMAEVVILILLSISCFRQRDQIFATATTRYTANDQ